MDTHLIPDDALAEDNGFELTCPSCNAHLEHDNVFAAWHVCGGCGRHFSIAARDRARLLVDDGSFRELEGATESFDAFDNNRISALDRIAGQYERPVLHDAIITGSGVIGGNAVVLIVMDDLLVSTHMGALGAEKIIHALEHAQARRMPVVSIVAGGSGSVLTGPLAVVQGHRVAAAAARLQALGVPLFGILTHPTSAPVFNSFASLCDVLFAEPGTMVGTMWSGGRSLTAQETAIGEEELLDCGWIDGIVARPEQRDRLIAMISLVTKHDVPALAQPDVPLPLDLKRSLVDYLDGLVGPFVELRGDRVDSDERQVVCGFGRLNDLPIAIAVQDAREPLKQDAAAALRKIQRLARFAGRFEMPMLMLVDGPDHPEPLRVSPGESFAAAKLSATMSVLPMPVISIGAGRIQGLVSNLMMTGDRVVMLDGAQYRLASAPSRAGRFPSGDVRGQSWSARETERMGLIDGVIVDAVAQWRDDPWQAARLLREEVYAMLSDLIRMGPRRLVETRHQHPQIFAHEDAQGMGLGVDVPEWTEVQQSVVRSFEEFRERLEQRVANQPRLSLQRPDLGEIAARLRSAQDELRNRDLTAPLKARQDEFTRSELSQRLSAAREELRQTELSHRISAARDGVKATGLSQRLAAKKDEIKSEVRERTSRFER